MFYNYEQHKQKLAEANRLNKIAVFGALVDAGITEVTVEFDGYGDSGQIQGITANAGKDTVKLPDVVVTVHQPSNCDDNEPLQTVDETLSEAVEALCYDYLAERHGGWEIDDGSFGSFQFDVPACTVELEYTQRSTEFYSEEF